MTEAEWLACTRLQLMLDFIRDRASARQSRLFACACCRLVWHLLPDLCHRLVEAVELSADVKPGSDDLSALFAGYDAHQVAVPNVPGGAQAAEAVGHFRSYWPWVTNPPGNEWYRAGNVARSAAESLGKSMPWQDARQREGELLRDLFGPPVFRPVAADPGWVTWNGGTVAKLAQGVYEDRAFDCLPILADALEDA